MNTLLQLTKQDKKNIEAETFRLAYMIECKATEYAKLYEAEFYRKLAERLNERAVAIEYIMDKFKE